MLRRALAHALIGCAPLLAGACCASSRQPFPIAPPSTPRCARGSATAFASTTRTPMPPGVVDRRRPDGRRSRRRRAVEQPGLSSHARRSRLRPRRPGRGAASCAIPSSRCCFPGDPNSSNATLQLPIDAIWQRPRRVEAATLDAEAVAARLMSDGLGVMAQARTAYLDAAPPRRGCGWPGNRRSCGDACEPSPTHGLREGDISEFEARAVRSEAAMAEAFGSRRRRRSRAGAHPARRRPWLCRAGSVALTPVDDLPVSPCESLDTLLTDALASRPDVRAAELAVEAAGARAGLEKSRILTLTATLDANGEGKEGFEIGPGPWDRSPAQRQRAARARAPRPR